MFHVKKMEPKDFAFAVDLANTMRWNMAAQDFEFNAELEPNGCFILLDDSEPAGLATCISYGKVGWFGNLVVAEKNRKQGAGTQLVTHAVNYLKSTGSTTIGLYAYPHLVDFYGALGFKRDVDFVVLKADAVSASPEPSENVMAWIQNDASSIVDLDEDCFGASRKKLLERILRNPDNVGYVAIGESGLVGFVAAKVYEEEAEIGPLVCSKNRQDKAVNLLKAELHDLRGLEAYLYLPAAETQLLEVAYKGGFREEFRLARMFFGRVAAKNCIYLTESLERG
jgi:GNAT superfamily N-acetyltransferase